MLNTTSFGLNDLKAAEGGNCISGKAKLHFVITLSLHPFNCFNACLSLGLAWITVFQYYYFFSINWMYLMVFTEIGTVDPERKTFERFETLKGLAGLQVSLWMQPDAPVTHRHYSLSTVCCCTVLRRRQVRHLQVANVKCRRAPSFRRRQVRHLQAGNMKCKFAMYSKCTHGFAARYKISNSLVGGNH